MAGEEPKSDPRWRVAILDDHERSRAALRAAIWAAGGAVVGEVLRCVDALALVRKTSPDVAVFAVGLPDGDGVDAARTGIDAGGAGGAHGAARAAARRGRCGRRARGGCSSGATPGRTWSTARAPPA